MEFNFDNPICIIQRESDGTFAYSHEGKVIELGSTLPGAVNELDRHGIIATHWLPKGDHARMTFIPTAVVRHHLTEDQIKTISDAEGAFRRHEIARLDEESRRHDRAINDDEVFFVVDSNGDELEIRGGLNANRPDGFTYAISLDGTTIFQIGTKGFIEGEYTAYPSQEAIAEAVGADYSRAP